MSKNIKTRAYANVVLTTNDNGNTTSSLDYNPVMYLRQGCRMVVTGNYYTTTLLKSVTLRVSLASYIGTDGIGDYEETRTCHNGLAFFDITAYLRQIYDYTIERVLYKKLMFGDKHLFATPYYFRAEESTYRYMDALHTPVDNFTLDLTFSDGTTSTVAVSNPIIVFEGSNEREDCMAEQRVHMLPINFKCAHEFCICGESMTNTSKETFDVVLNFDNGGSVTYTDTLPRNRESIWTNAMEIIYNGGLMPDNVRTATITYPNHIETQKPLGGYVTSVDDFDLMTFFDRVDKTDKFLVDRRTEGCFIRFVDRFGFCQQILLDVRQDDEAVSKDVTSNAFKYDARDYSINMGTNAGGNYISSEGDKELTSVSTTRTLKCGLDYADGDLIDDLRDLVASPIAVMYVGDISNAVALAQWQQVRVNGCTISEDKKKHLVSFECEIVIPSRKW